MSTAMILRNPYRDEFDHRPETGRHGRFRDVFYYTGDRYVLPLTKEEKRRSVWISLGFFAAMMALLAGAGLINTDSSRIWYVVFPYLCTFLPVVMFLMGLVYYAMAPLSMNRAEYEKGIRRMKYSVSEAIFLAAVSVITEIVFLVLHGGEAEFGREILYLILMAALTALLIGFGKYYTAAFSGLTVEKHGETSEYAADRRENRAASGSPEAGEESGIGAKTDPGSSRNDDGEQSSA